MKTSFITSLFKDKWKLMLYCILFLLPFTLNAQEDEDTYDEADSVSVITNENYLKNPDNYLRYIDSSKITTGVLIDRIKFKNDMCLYNGKSKVKTCDYAVLRRVYKDLKKASKKTAFLPEIDSIYDFAYQKMRWESIYPIAIINYNFNKVHKNALLNNAFETDTALVVKSYDSLFSTRKCFLASPFNIRMHGDNIMVAFYKNMYFSNNYKDSIIKLEANFGNGWQTFNWDEPKVVSFLGSTSYIEAKVRLTFVKQNETKQRKIISHFTVLRSGSDLVQEPSGLNESHLKSTEVQPSKTIGYPSNMVTSTTVCTSWDYNCLPLPQKKSANILPSDCPKTCSNYETYYDYSKCDIEANFLFNSNNSSKKLRKPLIICDGFDPGDKRDFWQTYIENLNEQLPFSRDTRGIYELLNGDPSPWYNSDEFQTYKASSAGLVASLQSSGYDIVVVNFIKGADDINYNANAFADFLTSVLNSSTYRDNQTEENVIIGPSMAGIITRLALTKIEKEGKEHYVREWFSFDSPQQGAYIPVDLQIGTSYFYTLLNAIGKDVTDTKEALDKLETPAAKQMLIKHHLTLNGTTLEAHADFNTMYSETLKNAGYPQLTRNIAITNGGTQLLYSNDEANARSLRVYKEEGITKDIYIDAQKKLLGWMVGKTASDVLIIPAKITYAVVNFIAGIFGKDVDNSITLKTSVRGYKYRDQSANHQVFWGYDEILLKDGADIRLSNQLPYDNAPGGWHSALYDINQNSSNQEKPDYKTLIETRWATFMVTSSALGVKPDATNIHYTWKDYQDNPTLKAQIPFDDFYGPTGVCEEHVRISKSTGDSVMKYLQEEDLTDIQRPRLINRTRNAQTTSGPLKLKGSTSVTIGGGSNYTYTMNATADVNIAASSKIIFKPGTKAVKGAKIKAKVGTTAVQKSAQVNTVPKPVTYPITSPYIGKLTSYDSEIDLQNEVVSEVLQEKIVNIYPNPTNGNLNIEISGQEPAYGFVSIFNTTGKIVFSVPINSANQQLDLSSLSNGMFFISVRLSGNTYREKVIISK